MKVKKVSDEVTFYKKVWESIIEINGNQVRVESWDEQDNLFNQYDADIEVNADDKKLLTEEEREVLDDYISDILDGKAGEEWETDSEDEKNAKIKEQMKKIDKIEPKKKGGKK